MEAVRVQQTHGHVEETSLSELLVMERCTGVIPGVVFCIRVQRVQRCSSVILVVFSGYKNRH